jgi:sugar phosphate isomerase/epimerase
MQSRLLPEINGKWQAYPAERWVEEFEIGRHIEIHCIEFLFDKPSMQSNALLSEIGNNQIIEIQKKTGVLVQSICADYFMQSSILDTGLARGNIKILKKLIHHANKLSIGNIVIPLLDNSSIKAKLDQSKLTNEDYFLSVREIFMPILDDLETANINICFETDLTPKSLLQFIEIFNSNCIKVNYDIGNSAGNGFSIEEEFKYFGHLIANVHIKDKPKGKPSILLGQGDANFIKAIELLETYNYSGNLIMETFRTVDGLAVFKHQYKWFQEQLNIA